MSRVRGRRVRKQRPMLSQCQRTGRLLPFWELVEDGFNPGILVDPNGAWEPPYIMDKPYLGPPDPIPNPSPVVQNDVININFGQLVDIQTMQPIPSPVSFSELNPFTVERIAASFVTQGGDNLVTQDGDQLVVET